MAKKPKQSEIKIIPAVLADKAAAEAALIELRTAAIAHDAAVAKREKEKDEHNAAVDLRFAPEIAGYQLVLKQRTADLTRWAITNRAEFGKLRSLETVAGWLKFRTGNWQLKLKGVRSWEDVLVRIRKHGLRSLFSRLYEDVNKQALLDARADQILARGGKKIGLADLGVRAFQEERFSIEIKRDGIPEPQVIVDEQVEAETKPEVAAK